MELEDPKDLRARFGKFLSLTNERKKMSKTTLRKRLALTVTTALFAGMLTVVSTPVASATHSQVGGSNNDAADGTVNASLFMAVASSTGTNGAITTDNAGTSATQKGLLSKDTSSGTAQTATVLAGGVLSFYAEVSTASAFTATGGSFSAADLLSDSGFAATYNAGNTEVVIPSTGTSATYVATLWTAPTTVGTYTVSLLTGFYLSSVGTRLVPSNDNLPPTLSGRVTVTVVASSAGGSYSASFSTCQVGSAGEALTAGVTGTGIDTTAIFADGDAAYINMDINDAYNQNLSSGAVIATATNGALVNVETSGAINAGTTTTDVFSSNGSQDTVRIDQPTSGAPLTTTVTITYNGTTVCTKTITFRGKAAKLVVANVGTQALSTASTSGSGQWMYQQTGVFNAGALFSVVATDSAGNVVSTPAEYGTYSASAATLTTTVQAISVNTRSTTATASSTSRFNYGSWTCGATAGSANVVLRFTITATGETISSDPFNARCAGARYSYEASLDKASYTQGELAKVTVRFLDSKGNPANTVTAVGANSWSLPFMTGIDVNLSGTNPASSTAVTGKNDGTSTYTLAVGTTTGLTAGTFTGVIEFTDATIVSAKATPTYKLSTGGDTTTNADVLKSIVALIASINKQIQALQKLILKR